MDKEQELLTDEELELVHAPSPDLNDVAEMHNIVNQWRRNIAQAQIAKLKSLGYEQVWEDCSDCKGKRFTSAKSTALSGYHQGKLHRPIDHKLQPCSTCKGTGKVGIQFKMDKEELREKIDRILDSIEKVASTGVKLPKNHYRLEILALAEAIKLEWYRDGFEQGKFEERQRIRSKRGMKCVCCGKITSLNDKQGYWQRWDFKRRWVCRDCECSGKYLKDRPDERDICCVHGLPCIQGTRCEQCIKEGR